MKFHIFIILALILNFCFVTIAQVSNLSFNQIDSRNGLIERYNSFIYKDSKGFIWISSISGVYRYDGSEMINYNSLNLQGSGMIGENIQSKPLEDTKGNIWLSTYKAINVYNWEQNTFSAIQFTKNLEKDTIQNKYRVIFIENDSLLYAQAGDSIYIHNLHSREYKAIAKTSGVRYAVDTSSTGIVERIISCPWNKQFGFEVISLDSERVSTVKQHLKDGVFIDNSFTKAEIMGVDIDEQEMLWLFSNKGLILYDLDNSVVIDVFSLPNGNEDVIINGSLLGDSIIFVSAMNSGVWTFDINRRKFIRSYSKESSDISFNNIYEVYIDPHDHIWLSSMYRAELNDCWLSKNVFHNPLQEFRPNQLPIINSLIQKKDGEILCHNRNRRIFHN